MPPTLLLTGASSGIGRSLAHHLAGDYRVLALARRLDRMERAFADEPEVHPYELDLSDPDGVVPTVRTLRETHGPIEYAINNAGVNPDGRVEDLDADDWHRAFQVNAVAPAQITRELLPDMRERDFGRIVNVTSGAPLECPPGAGAYAASKAALNALTVTAAREHADRDVKLNLLSPGPCRTEMAPDAPLEPSACHPTVDYLLDLDADGPTGRFFWLGHEVSLFPDLGDVAWEQGEPSDAMDPVL